MGIEPRYCSFYDFDPWFAGAPWSSALEGKRVFVVSPFFRTFQKQYQRRTEIWPGRNILPTFEIDGYVFPYLISESYPLTWQQVFRDVEAAMRKSDYDIALLGCGAMALPLGNVAKQMRRQALHLGGMLQILFGVHGQRYRETETYAKMINSAWIKPEATETPKEFKKIENGCYW